MSGLDYLKVWGKHLLTQIEFPLETLIASYNALWFLMIDVDDVDGIGDRIMYYVCKDSRLALVKDYKNRPAMDMATPANREAINSVLLWFGRFRQTEGRPEHESVSCLVYKVVDELELDEDGKPIKRALNLMRNKNEFDREVGCRTVGFSPEYVMSIVKTFEPTGLPETVSVVLESGKVLSKEQAESFYCIVLPLADRNLFVAIKQERFVNRK